MRYYFSIHNNLILICSFHWKPIDLVFVVEIFKLNFLVACSYLCAAIWRPSSDELKMTWSSANNIIYFCYYYFIICLNCVLRIWLSDLGMNITPSLNKTYCIHMWRFPWLMGLFVRELSYFHTRSILLYPSPFLTYCATLPTSLEGKRPYLRE